MTVSPEVLQGILQLRSRSEFLLSELGRMELAKSSIISDINALNDKINLLLKQESSRLGIPQGVAWQITPEGKAIIKE
jgi:hypothetical protein